MRHAEIRVSDGSERWHGQILAPAGWWVLLASDYGPIAYFGPHASRDLATAELAEYNQAAPAGTDHPGEGLDSTLEGEGSRHGEQA